MLKKLITTVCLAGATISSAYANDFLQHPNYPAFKQKTMQSYGLTAQQVDNAMYGAKNINRILTIMTAPGESKPWHQYKQNFLVDSTIQRGVRFKNQHADTLRRAEQTYGVPQSIILGILGVETGFGSNKGSFVTRDALATLAFGYPRRADYFSDELSALIAWAYQDGRTASSVVGSYAGAIGFPQFMPSNINKFGVDFDGNGHIDLTNSAADAIGSIANYLAKHGWQKDRPIGFAAYYSGTNPETIIATDLTQPTPYGKLQQLGLKPINSLVKIDNLDMVNGIKLDDTQGPIYYITYPNFQVITTYNRSRMYATAVWQLGEAVNNR